MYSFCCCCCCFLLRYACVCSIIAIICVYCCVNFSDYRILAPMRQRYTKNSSVQQNPKKISFKWMGFWEIELRKITCEIPGRATFSDAINGRLLHILFGCVLSVLPQLILCTIVGITTVSTVCACVSKWKLYMFIAYFFAIKTQCDVHHHHRQMCLSKKRKNNSCSETVCLETENSIENWTNQESSILHSIIGCVVDACTIFIHCWRYRNHSLVFSIFFCF